MNPDLQKRFNKLRKASKGKIERQVEEDQFTFFIELLQQTEDPNVVALRNELFAVIKMIFDEELQEFTDQVLEDLIGRFERVEEEDRERKREARRGAKKSNDNDELQKILEDYIRSRGHRWTDYDSPWIKKRTLSEDKFRDFWKAVQIMKKYKRR